VATVNLILWKKYFTFSSTKAIYELRVCPQNPFVFYSCGQDGTCKFYDIRQSTKCDKSSCQEHTLIKNTTGITASKSL